MGGGRGTDEVLLEGAAAWIAYIMIVAVGLRHCLRQLHPLLLV